MKNKEDTTMKKKHSNGSVEDEIAVFCSDLLGPGTPDEQKALAIGLAKLTPEQWQFMYALIKTLSGDKK